jgi:hypothetical protein
MVLISFGVTSAGRLFAQAVATHSPPVRLVYLCILYGARGRILINCAGCRPSRRRPSSDTVGLAPLGLELRPSETSLE